MRRDNYYPLQTVVRTSMHIETATYADFEYLPRTAGTESLLHIGRYPDAFLLQTGERSEGACADFGSYESLIGRKP